LGVDLADGTGGQVAGVGKGRLPCCQALLVEGVEVLFEHDDLAADLGAAVEEGFVLFGGSEVQGDVLDGAHVGRDVLADEAVAAGDCLGKNTVLVDEGAGQAVHFDVGKELMRAAGQELVHAPRPSLHFPAVEDVVEAHHAHAVGDFLEATQQFVADALGGAVGGD